MGAKTQVVILLVAAQAGVLEVQAQDAAAAGMTVEERLERIESALSNQGLLELVQQLQILETEVSRLRGETEVQNHALEQLKKRQRDLYTDVDRRIQRIEHPVTTTTGAPAGEDEPPLQTLSPFQGTEVTGGRQAETPLTLELVGGEPGAAGAEGEDTVPLAAAPEIAVSETPEATDAAALAPETPEDSGAETSLPETSEDMDAETPLPGTPEAMGAEASLPEAPEDSGTEAPLPETSEDVDAETPLPETPVEVSPGRVEAEYQQAFSLLKQSLYDRSITAFQDFLARYPDSDYAGDAQFWLAEAYYVNGYFEQALLEYDALARQYPESRKLSQAQLKAALCRYELGQAEAARTQLEAIIQQYPGTTAASLARDRLAEIAAAAAPAD